MYGMKIAIVPLFVLRCPLFSDQAAPPSEIQTKINYIIGALVR